MKNMTVDYILAHWDDEGTDATRLMDWYALEELRDGAVSTVMLGTFREAEEEMLNMATSEDNTCAHPDMAPFFRIRLLGMDEAWHEYRQCAGLEDYGITHRQAAFALGCSVQWVYKLIEDGKLALTEDGRVSHMSVEAYASAPRSKGGRPRKDA